MAYELVYTSAPEGLNRGSSGFCVVACTKGLGPRLIVTLEGLSAYKPLYPHYAPNAWDNPISRSHYLYEANGIQQHILSRICFNGVDHTQRSNKLASHLVLNEKETLTAAGGPSSLLLHEELFKDASWAIKAEYYTSQKAIPATQNQFGKCLNWEKVMGDAGWGGYLAQLYLDSPGKNVYIAYEPGQNPLVLPLFHEALSLLPENLRWKVTFNTYFVNLPAGMSCTWRGCPADSEALRAAHRAPSNVIVDITKPRPLAQDGKLIQLARTGIMEMPKVITPVPQEAVERESAPELLQPKLKKLPPLTRPKIVISNKRPNFIRREKSNVYDNSNLQSEKIYTSEMNDDYEEQSSSSIWKIVAIVAGIVLLLAGTGYGIWWRFGEPKTVIEKLENKYNEVFNSVKDDEDIKKELDMLKYEIGEETNGERFHTKRLRKLLEQIDDKIAQIDKAEKDRIAAEKKAAADRRAKEAADRRAKEAADRRAKEAADRRAKDNKQKPKTETVAGKGPKTESQKSQTNKTTVEPKKADDRQYLWTKSREFHNLGKNGKLNICVGNTKKENIHILQVGENSNVGIDQKLSWVDDQMRKSEIKMKISDGTLVIERISDCEIPQDAEILIRLNEKDYPLFFRIDVSKIKPKQKKCDLKWENGKFHLSSFSFPERYYEKSGKCTNEIEWCLKKDSHTVRLKRTENAFAFSWENEELKRTQKELENLEKIKREIGKCESILLDVLKETFKEEAAKINEKGGAENFKNRILADAKLDELAKKLEEQKLKGSKELKELLKGRTDTWNKESAKVKKEFEKAVETCIKGIKSTSLYLKCGDKEYAQFPLTKILP